MCQWDTKIVDGRSTLLHTGISQAEIESACNNLRVPRSERPHVSSAVRVMAGHVMGDLNRE